MDKKIVVIGAGVGGCYVAELLGKLGNDVTVYEIAKRGEVSYDWHDDINPSVFKKVGITLPEEKFWFRKNNWTFVSPSEKTAIAINLPEEKLDFSLGYQTSTVSGARAYEKKMTGSIRGNVGAPVLCVRRRTGSGPWSVDRASRSGPRRSSRSVRPS